MENSTKNKIVLAALLHDIGKFYQRADDAGARRSKMLDQPVKELEEMYCPLIKNTWRGYKHVIWTAQFLADNETFFKHLLKDDYGRFFKAAVSHHRPDPSDIWQLIVQKADHYSSGADRTKEKGIMDASSEKNWDSFKNVRMVSIFEGLLSKETTYQKTFPITSLATEKEFFPANEHVNKGQEDYASLWTTFSQDFEKLKASSQTINATIENLLSLLEKYTTTIPSSTKHLPDVSLYDHLKSTAGLAACIYDYLEEKNEATKLDLSATDAPVLMIGGDLSGIQKYIYDIISKGAAKNLKGRSFYLYLLTDNIVRYILRELSLTNVNVLYASGGGFYLIAPNTKLIVDTIHTIQRDLEKKIFAAHGTKLFLGIGYTPVTQQMILQQDIHLAWKALMQNIAKTKRQKFKGLLNENYEKFFQPIEVGGKQAKDAITNEELTEQENADVLGGGKQNLVKPVESGFIKWSTYDQIELGRKLKDVQWWVVSHQKITHWKKQPFEICDLGIYNYLFTKEDLEQTSARFSVDNAYITTFDIGQLSYAPKIFSGTNNSYHFSFYGGNDYPKDEKGELLTFDQLAEKANGTNKLGILRMDVDNLGSIFARGLSHTDRTFSKYSTLSRNLDFFFKGYLNTIWQQEAYRDATFIIYAGGDDLFIVGAWDALTSMAKEINKEFKEWTCHNQHISLSGGMAIVSGKFPITKGADMAEQAEKIAKSHNYNQQEKNAFALLGRALNWESELPIVENIKEQLVAYTTNNSLPRGILNKLIQYAQIAKYQQDNQLSPKWRWHMAYDFSRASKRTKDETAKDFYDQIKVAAYTDKWKNQPINQKYTFLELLEVAARWAELETKN